MNFTCSLHDRYIAVPGEAIRAISELRSALEAAFGPALHTTVPLQCNAYHGFLLHLRERRPQARHYTVTIPFLYRYMAAVVGAPTEPDGASC